MKVFQLQPFQLKNIDISFILNWRIIRYIIFFVLIALPVSLLSTIGYRSELIFLAVRLFQLSIFIFLGVLHTGYLKKRSPFIHLSKIEKFYFSIVLTMSIYVTLLLLYFIVKSDMQSMAFISSCAFLLPYTIVQAWNYFLLFPEKNSYVWNGYKQTHENPDIVFLNTILVNIRLTTRYHHSEESLFLVNTPLHLELGQVFNYFLNIENYGGKKTIECMGGNNEPFGWKFYAVCFGGLYKRLLDPEKSLQNNRNIKKNTVIIAKRVVI